MKKNNGFTLVELMCVLVLLGLLMAIAVPNAIKLNVKVNEKAYTTKIDLIEQSAVNYGQSNLALVRKGADFSNTALSYKCVFNFDNKTRKVKSVTYSSEAYVEGESLGSNTYRCSKVKVSDLVASNNLDWDYKNQCSGCNASDKELYNNVVINPVTKYIINKCNIYIYYRNSRVYAYFDKTSCDLGVKSNTIQDGYEYRPKMGEFKAD